MKSSSDYVSFMFQLMLERDHMAIKDMLLMLNADAFKGIQNDLNPNKTILLDVYRCAGKNLSVALFCSRLMMTT